MAIGIVVASLRVSPVAPLRAVGTVYVETLRNIPLLLILLFIVFAVPKLGPAIDYFPAAVPASRSTPARSSPRPSALASTPSVWARPRRRGRSG